MSGILFTGLTVNLAARDQVKLPNNAGKSPAPQTEPTGEVSKSKPPLPVAPSYWDANSWEIDSGADFWNEGRTREAFRKAGQARSDARRRPLRSTSPKVKVPSAR